MIDKLSAEKTFRCDSPKTHGLKIVSGLVMGAGLLPVFFMALGSLEGGGNDLSEWGETWWPVGATVFTGGLVWALYLTYGYYSTLTLTSHPSLGLQVNMREPDGDEISASGTWRWYAYYTKEYARYGMYKRHKHLVLFHKDREWIAFTKDTGVLDDPQPPYILKPGELALNVPVYRSRAIDDILKELSGNENAKQIGSGQKTESATQN